MHRYARRRNGGDNEQKTLIDYLLVNEIKKEVLDTKVAREMLLNLYHYMVIAKIEQ